MPNMKTHRKKMTKKKGTNEVFARLKKPLPRSEESGLRASETEDQTCGRAHPNLFFPRLGLPDFDAFLR
jgi:hypothetical protein